MLIILAIFMFFMRQMQGGMGGGRGGPMSFGKSKARLISEDQIKTTFADVAGCDEAKDDVAELVEFLKDPGKFQRLGGRIPRGVLMAGPQELVKHLLLKRLRVRRKYRFSQSLVRISLKCLWVWEHHASVTCLNRQRNRPLVLFLLTRSTRWAVSAVRVSVGGTMSESKPEPIAR